MTREEMLKFCFVCKNSKMDYRGLVCSLTDDYADCNPVCENYSQDDRVGNCHSEKEEVRTKENSQLTLDKIMDCIRKAGYYPQKLNENLIEFKIQGERFDVTYDTEHLYFTMFKIYPMREEEMPAVKRAAYITGTKILTRKYLVFRAGGFVSSSFDFERQFPDAIEHILKNIDYFKTIFKTLKRQQVENT